MLHFNKLFLLFLCINLSVTAMQNADHIITEGTEEQIIALLQNGYQYNAKILYEDLELTLLYIVIMRGQVEVIKYLQSLGVDINAPITEGPRQGYTPMHIAAYLGQLEVIKYLQSQHIDINAPTTEGPNQGFTPMHIAAYLGQLEVIKYLQSQHIDINAPTTEGPNQGYAPMHIAAAYGQVEIIKYLQSQHIDINTPIAAGPRQGLTPMHIAAAKGQIEVIKYLQSQHIDINAPITEGPRQGVTPMHIAAAHGQIEVIKYLQSQHIDINAPVTEGPCQGLTPLHIAAGEGHVEVIKYLQSQGVDINAPMTERPGQGYAPMHLAASNGQIEVIKYLQSQGKDINAPMTEGARQGMTPMHIAAAEGQIEVIKHLQSQGVDVNTKIAREDQFKGMTALCLTAQRSLPAIQTLVWLGAQLDHLGPDSEQSAYQYADQTKNALYLIEIAPHTQSLLALCRQLNTYLQSQVLADANYSEAFAHECEKSAVAIKEEIKCGAELNAIDLFGKTTLHHCIQFYNPKAPTSFDELAKDIIKKRTNVNVVDKDGFTPLGRACLYGNYRLVRLLLSQDKEHRADPTIGINPLYITLTTSNWPLMHVLLNLAHN